MRRLIQSIGLAALVWAAGCGYDPKTRVDVRIGDDNELGELIFTDYSTRFITKYVDAGFDGTLDRVEYRDSNGIFVLLDKNSPYYNEFKQKFLETRERAARGR